MLKWKNNSPLFALNEEFGELLLLYLAQLMLTT